MEISSDHGRSFGPADDAAVDIDLDLTSDNNLEHMDDDYILEDAHSENGDYSHSLPDAVNDDIMQDEDEASQIMEDETILQDEELFDVTEEPNLAGHNAVEIEFDPPAVTEQIIDAEPISFHSAVPGEKTTATANASENTGSRTVQSPVVKSPTTSPSSQQPRTRNPFEDNSAPDSLSTNAHAVGEESGSEPAVQPTASTGLKDVEEAATANEPDENKPRISEVNGEVYSTDLHEDAVLAEEVVGPDSAPSVPSHTPDPSLHPVIVVYEGSEVSLFPPSNGDNSDTYFLEDEALAHESFDELFKAIRSVLGDSIDSNQELHLNFADLGISISEASVHSAKTTLAVVLDLFVKLMQLDGIDFPAPMLISLTTKTSLPTLIESLQSLATEGKGLSHRPLPNTDGSEFRFDTENAYTRDDTLNGRHTKDHEIDTTAEDPDSKLYANIEESEVTAQEVATPQANVLNEGNSHHSYSQHTSLSNPGESVKSTPENISPTSGAEGNATSSGAEQAQRPEATEVAAADNGLEAKEDGDLIDYEEEEHDDWVGDAKLTGSRGSSTLQGDEQDTDEVPEAESAPLDEDPAPLGHSIGGFVDLEEEGIPTNDLQDQERMTPREDPGEPAQYHEEPDAQHSASDQEYFEDEVHAGETYADADNGEPENAEYEFLDEGEAGDSSINELLAGGAESLLRESQFALREDAAENEREEREGTENENDINDESEEAQADAVIKGETIKQANIETSHHEEIDEYEELEGFQPDFDGDLDTGPISFGEPDSSLGTALAENQYLEALDGPTGFEDSKFVLDAFSETMGNFDAPNDDADNFQVNAASLGTDDQNQSPVNGAEISSPAEADDFAAQDDEAPIAEKGGPMKRSRELSVGEHSIHDDSQSKPDTFSQFAQDGPGLTQNTDVKRSRSD